MFNRDKKKEGKQTTGSQIAASEEGMAKVIDLRIAEAEKRWNASLVELAKRVAALEGQQTLRTENAASEIAQQTQRIDDMLTYTAQLSLRITKLEEAMPVSRKKHAAVPPSEHLDTDR